MLIVANYWAAHTPLVASSSVLHSHTCLSLAWIRSRLENDNSRHDSKAQRVEDVSTHILYGQELARRPESGCLGKRIVAVVMVASVVKERETAAHPWAIYTHIPSLGVVGTASSRDHNSVLSVDSWFVNHC
jgi:hypothetical protein